jgi:outer membrane lipoprotein carrier protein
MLPLMLGHMKTLVGHFKICVLASIWAWGTWTHADGLQALENFLQQAQSAQGQFTQVVTSPPKQGETVGKRKTSSGQFAIARPNKFRFDYKKPFEQLMVSDGQTLWIYDADLQQLTQRKLSEVVAGTPAVLLTGSSLAELQKSFTLKSLPDKDGLQWVQATPRAKETSIANVELGFEAGNAGRIAALNVTDGFGQVSQMKLTQVSYGAVAAEQFVYRAGKTAKQ